MKCIAVLAGLGVAIAAGLACADANSPVSHDHSSGKADAHVPGLGEIMSLQQMRHAKLWLGGSRGNWALAGYELAELREGFEDAGKLHPTRESVPIAALIAKLTPAPLEALGRAIEARNPTQFKTSFDKLTAACNTCHRAANHGFIKIKRPGSSAFGNQEFEPVLK